MSEPRTLSLHVPEPDVRPGGTPDFSNLRIPDAGAVPRPEIDANPEDMREMSFSIIRVLNNAGEAVGPWAGLRVPDGGEVLFGVRDGVYDRYLPTKLGREGRHAKRRPLRSCLVYRTVRPP